jgi:hypothetical protein
MSAMLPEILWATIWASGFLKDPKVFLMGFSINMVRIFQKNMTEAEKDKGAKNAFSKLITLAELGCGGKKTRI